MVRSIRPVWVALATAAAVYVGAFSTIALHGSGQATASQTPTPAQAAPYVGDWVVTTAMGGTQSTSLVSVKTDGGKVTATVQPEGQAPITNTAVAMAGSSLVIRYTREMGGNTIPTALTLTPQGDDMRVNMAVMDGQYELTGMAAKQAPGATFPGPQRGAAGAAGRFGGRSQTNENTDFTPKTPIKARTAAEEAKGFLLPPGYRMEIVASDPDVISPGVIEFDGNGRMYVSELVSYMMTADAANEHDPISRISRWESTKGDGVYDKHTVFADRLVAPRMILPLGDGVILTSETDSDDIIRLTDTNGDGVADKREVVYTGIGQNGDANIEHQKAGLVWNLDNWIYTTYNPFRIRWTPSGFLKEPTGPNGGQWGLGTDDDGKAWFVDAGGERGPMNFQYPIHYGAFTPCQAASQRGAARGTAAPAVAANPNCPPGMENGFEKDFATVWPAPSIGDMQGGIYRIRMPFQNLNHFTATTGPAIFRGDALPADLKGQLLFTEPVGRLIRRASVDNVEGLTELKNVYPQSEFITSEDQLFRPVNISNAPDGTLYIADMYHGIIQEREWSGPGEYLRAKIEQYQLDKIVSYGRVWRLRYDGRPAVEKTDTNIGQPAIAPIRPRFAPPHMYSETPAQLVAHLTDPNGWWRDMAQRLIVLKQDTSVVPALQQMARTNESINGRIHALWTLEGLSALDAGLTRELMHDKNPRLRIQAIRASETLYKAGDKSFADDYRAMTKDADVNVAIQGMLSASLFKLKDLAEVVKATQASHKEKGVALIGDRLLAPSTPAFGTGGGRRGAPPTPAEEKRLQQGSDIFGAVCFACHGSDGTGTPMEGAPAGTMLAPPLAGSPRVQAHRDYIVKVLMRGLNGPIDGKSYRDVMVPLDNTDEWIASVASYVRTSFGNSGDMVTPADVARVRAEIAAHKTPWTVPELEATMPRALDPQQFKLTASHGTDTAEHAATLRGWSSGVPQIPGMWFQVELPQPAQVTELQFDSVAAGGRGGRRGAAPGAAPPPAPVVGYPRAYDVQVSMDGKKWTKVASGQGAARTTATFAPTQAKFVRITQTDNIPDAPAWSIRSLRVLEMKAEARR